MLGCVFGQTVLMKALRFVELWGTSISASHSGNMVGAPWYVRNADLHRDLLMDMVTAEVKRFARKHEERLLHHNNVEGIQLLDNGELMRGLKRTKPFELV